MTERLDLSSSAENFSSPGLFIEARKGTLFRHPMPFGTSMRRTLLRLGRGDITRWAADAIATSTNAGLCGNRTPSYWRFQRRPDNIDGAVHAAAGPALANALSELAAARGFPYSSPTGDAISYRGSLLPAATGGQVACPAGCAVHTQSFGALAAHTQLVVHGVAPDGIFRTGPPGAAEALLRATFRSVVHEAARAGATSLAIPCIGCGVNGWEPARVAYEALHAAAEWIRGGEADVAAGLQRIDFVMGSDATWEAFTQRVEAMFGRADESTSDPAVLQWSGADCNLPCAPAEAVQHPQRSRNARRSAQRRERARAVRAELRPQSQSQARARVPSVSQRTSFRSEVTL